MTLISRLRHIAVLSQLAPTAGMLSPVFALAQFRAKGELVGGVFGPVEVATAGSNLGWPSYEDTVPGCAARR